MRHPLPALAAIAAVTLAAGAYAAPEKVDPAVAKAIAAPERTAAERARDSWRHPAETLTFFGVTPDKKVVEFAPGGGWYTAILTRIPGSKGSYTALVTSPSGVEATTKLLADKGLKGGVAKMDVTTGTSDVPAGSVDVVVTFRNVHNLLMGNNPTAATNAFKAWHAMLKPGGTLGIVDHRLPEARDAAQEKTSGYLKRSTVVKLAEGAGFKLAGESEVNANPKDTADHPEGVWTLPPVQRLKEVDRAKYEAIGESDRMTLKFVKAK